MKSIIEPMIKEGSLWSGGDLRVEFTVLHTIDDEEGHTWVHYRDNRANPKEYSCYKESFLARFSPLPART
jgi:hypothetical protein